LKPSLNLNKGTDYWTKRISDQEMPALCSTVRDLEKLAKDDVSSLAILGRSVMHDNALTSRILRVANSATYNKGINHVSTVSRAAVMLGFDTLRNICITARLLTSLLENKNLTPSVYQRLLKLMAQSFQAAMLARMMMEGHDEKLREEVFIASLLYRIGESAFWSTGGNFTDALDRKLQECEDDAQAQAMIRQVLGTSFTQLTQSIARHWGLGDVLLKSLSLPDERMPEIRCIAVADKLSELLIDAQPDQAQFVSRFKQAAEMLGIDVDEFKQKVVLCTQTTQKLTVDYGANVLLAYLPKGDELFVKTEDVPVEKPVRLADTRFQLKKLRELTGYALTKTDFNQIMITALEGILSGVGVDRCGVLLLSPNRKLLQPRVMLGDEAESMKQEFIIRLEDPRSLFAQCIEGKQPILVPDPNDKQWQASISEPLKARLSKTGFVLAPVLIDTRVIGLFYADKHHSGRTFEEDEFDNFIHFTQLANICFGVSVK
jgi:HD-like signal output (HDOD) protein